MAERALNLMLGNLISVQALLSINSLTSGKLLHIAGLVFSPIRENQTTIYKEPSSSMQKQVSNMSTWASNLIPMQPSDFFKD